MYLTCARTRSRKDVKYVNRCSLAYNACATLLVGLHFSPKGCFRAAFGAFARRPFRRRTEWARSGYRAHSVQTRCPWRGDRGCGAGARACISALLACRHRLAFPAFEDCADVARVFSGCVLRPQSSSFSHRVPGALPMSDKAF